MKKRNKFKLDNYKVLTCDMGELVPIGIQEVLPGDSFNHSASALVRLSPLASPVMHPCHAMIHHWFVPFRLIWDEWEDFITGGPNGVSAPVYPTVTTPVSVGFPVGSLADYLGVPPTVPSRQASALPFRAYQLIFNQCYRDEDLMTAATISKASGADTTTTTTLQRVAWPKDYATTARPWEQKGAEVSMPLVGNANVKGIGTNAASATFPTAGTSVRESGGGTVTYAQGKYTHVANEIIMRGTAASNGYPDVYVSGADFDAPSVNEFRFSMAWQRVLEARARFGSRYSELLKAWGVNAQDSRLQRPEYLGGGKETIQFSEVLGTADTNLAKLGGHGISALKSNRYNKFFQEHGFVISVMFIRPISLYATGLERLWNRRTREEFWQPELQHLGQQAVKNKEVWMAHATPDGTFGYQDRFDELRHGTNTIAGEIRTTLDSYTLARIFSSQPALNSSFVTCTPTKDIYSAPSEDGLIVMTNHRISARRLVAKTGSSFIK